MRRRKAEDDSGRGRAAAGPWGAVRGADGPGPARAAPGCPGTENPTRVRPEPSVICLAFHSRWILTPTDGSGGQSGQAGKQ